MAAAYHKLRGCSKTNGDKHKLFQRSRKILHGTRSATEVVTSRDTRLRFENSMKYLHRRLSEQRIGRKPATEGYSSQEQENYFHGLGTAMEMPDCGRASGVASRAHIAKISQARTSGR